jgi:thiosulfate reductase cytochrome b subunit
VDLAGLLVPGPGGSLVFQRAAGASPGGLHVRGRARQSAPNTLGFLIFLAVAGSVALHGLARLALRRRAGANAPAPRAAGEPEYVFGRYERLWHWTMAGSGVVLILTGLVVHGAGGRWPIGLPTAVAWHNGAAVVLIANASLALFYHLATAAIRNFIPAPRGLLGRILEHVEYQSRGIFRGGPHPANQPGHKLNPLQQLTYLALLNVLFPLQIGTGAAIWAIGNWPTLGAAVGGLSVLAPVHNLGAWLFLAFFVLHVYLVTTGRTVGEHLAAMITGWQATDPASGEPGGTP